MKTLSSFLLAIFFNTFGSPTITEASCSDNLNRLNQIYLQKQKTISDELKSVYSFEDWKSISNDAKLEFIEWNSDDLINLKVHSSSDGYQEENVSAFSRLISIERIQTSPSKEFALQMLKFMQDRSNMTIQDGRRDEIAFIGELQIYAEVLSTSSGEILGGRFYAQQDIVYEGNLPSSKRRGFYQKREDAQANGLDVGYENYSIAGYFDESLRPLRYDPNMQYDH